MTLADRIEVVLLEQGPLPADSIAVAVRKRRTDVLHALRSDGRFVHTGKRKASRWDVMCVMPDGSFTLADVAVRWRPFTEQFIADFEEIGLVERVNGNGRLRVTEQGLEVSAVMHAAANAWGWTA